MARKYKHFQYNLSEDSIDNLIKQLEDYRDSINEKNTRLIEELSEVGIKVINSVVSKASSEMADVGEITTTIENLQTGEITEAKIKCSGKDILFIEFSSGITYGTSEYPTPAGEPFGMGTYPGNGHWDDPNGWWFKGSDGESKHTYGNRAYMPVYHAEEAIILTYQQIAMKVFGG